MRKIMQFVWGIIAFIALMFSIVTLAGIATSDPQPRMLQISIGVLVLSVVTLLGLEDIDF